MMVEGYSGEIKEKIQRQALQRKREMQAAATEEKQQKQGYDPTATPSSIAKIGTSAEEQLGLAKSRLGRYETEMECLNQKIAVKGHGSEVSATLGGMGKWLKNEQEIQQIQLQGEINRTKKEISKLEDTVYGPDRTPLAKVSRTLYAGMSRAAANVAQCGDMAVSAAEEVERLWNGGFTQDGTYVKGEAPLVSSLFGRVHDVSADVTKEAEAELAQSAANWKGSKTGEIFNEVAVNAISLVPQVALPIISGGTSVAGQLAPQMGVVETALRKLVSDPKFWYLFVQNAGQSYGAAKKAGASDAEAVVSGTFSGLSNSMIDLGGGYENSGWMNVPGLTAGQIAQNIGKSALEQSGEEYLKSAASRFVEKYYDNGKKLFSVTDENAVFNPGRDAKEFVLNFGTAALLETGGFAVKRFTEDVSAALQKQGMTKKEAEREAKKIAETAQEQEFDKAFEKGFNYYDKEENLKFIEDDAMLKAESGLPKKVTLENEALAASVIVNQGNIQGIVPSGAELENVYIMAGMGTCTPIRDLKRLYCVYPEYGDAMGWMKKSGTAYGKYHHYVIHWYENNGKILEDELKLKG